MTQSVFSDLSDILKKKASILSDKMKKEDKFVEVEFISKGGFESHFKFSGDCVKHVLSHNNTKVL